MRYLILLYFLLTILSFKSQNIEKELDSMDLRWCTKVWDKLDEPVNLTSGKDSTYQIYRLTYLNSLFPTITIRIEKNKIDSNFTVIAKSLTTIQYNQNGILKDEYIKDMELKRTIFYYKEYNLWDSLISNLSNYDFWVQPSNPGSNDILSTDGITFYLEGYENGNYHLIKRRNPSNEHINKYDDFKTLCDFYFHLIHIGYEKIWWDD